MSQIYVTKFGLRCSVARTRSKFFDARKKMRGCAAHTWRFLAKPVEHCRVYLEIHIAFRKPGSAGEQNHVTKRNFRHVKGVYSSDILSCRKWHISRQPGYLGYHVYVPQTVEDVVHRKYFCVLTTNCLTCRVAT